jgi:hypothetical protein
MVEVGPAPPLCWMDILKQARRCSGVLVVIVQNRRTSQSWFFVFVFMSLVSYLRSIFGTVLYGTIETVDISFCHPCPSGRSES